MHDSSLTTSPIPITLIRERHFKYYFYESSAPGKGGCGEFAELRVPILLSERRRMAVAQVGCFRGGGGCPIYERVDAQ
jgi:hypothetical protein